MGPSASREEVTELLGEAVDDEIVERIVATGASVDDIADAIDDVEREVREGERRIPVSTMVADVRAVLEELPFDDEPAYAYHPMLDAHPNN